FLYLTILISTNLCLSGLVPSSAEIFQINMSSSFITLFFLINPMQENKLKKWFLQRVP
ncbi:hypothetical protein L9F63_003509, partial [Diploptera punctata]